MNHAPSRNIRRAPSGQPPDAGAKGNRPASRLVAVPATIAALVGAIVLLGDPELSAQAPAGSQSAPTTQAPTFRSSVRLIDVDVYVTDSQGRPVKGLTRDDFELLEF